MSEPPRQFAAFPPPRQDLPARIARAAEPLPEIDDPAFAALIDR